MGTAGKIGQVVGDPGTKADAMAATASTSTGGTGRAWGSDSKAGGGSRCA